jgi:hypothetical protein
MPLARLARKSALPTIPRQSASRIQLYRILSPTAPGCSSHVAEASCSAAGLNEALATDAKRMLAEL